MATKLAVKYTFSTNGNPAWHNANLTSADSTWDANFPTWKTAYQAFLAEHDFNGTSNFRVKHEVIDANTITSTYILDGSTSENIQTNVRMYIWSVPVINDACLWRDTVYNTTKQIIKTNTEIINVEV
jgi:hypothetical protein